MDSQSEKLDNLFSMGQKAYAAGDYTSALKHFLDAANCDPENYKIGEQVGDTLQALGRTDQAIQMYKKTAEAYLNHGSIIKAIAIHKIVLALNPSDLDVKNQLVSIFGSQIPEEFASVVAASEEAAKKAPPPTPKAESGRGGAGEGFEVFQGVDELNMVFREILGEDHNLKDFGKNTTAPPSNTQEVFMRTPLFSSLTPEELNSLIDKVSLVNFGDADFIIREGDMSQELWVIVQGRVEIVTGTDPSKRILLATLSEGDFFGEGGFVNASMRSASAIAKGNVKVLRIDRQDFDDVSVRYPHLQDVLQVFYKNRMADRIMAQSELFGVLPTFRRAELMQSFVQQAFKAGETILEAGDPQGYFYLVESGKVELSYNNDKIRESLNAGDFFGEWLAALGEPLNISAKALEETHTLMLRRIEVEGLQQMFPELDTILKRFAQKRAGISK